MLITSSNSVAETNLEKMLHAVLEPEKKLSAEQFKKMWAALDARMEERDEEEQRYVINTLIKAATDPGSTMHPDVLHDEVNVMLKVFYQLKTCCPEIYDRRITEQVLLQVLCADVLSLCKEGECEACLDDAGREKLSLTQKKLDLLDRNFSDALLAWEKVLLLWNNCIGFSFHMRSGNLTETFLTRWKELSGRKVEVPSDDVTNSMFIRHFKEPDEDEGPVFHPVNSFLTSNVTAGWLKSMISGVDHFVKKVPCPELAELIVRKKDMELTVTALNNNLISADAAEIGAAVEAAVQEGEIKVIPMLIRKRWEAG